jgi:hypothetical protein
VPLAAGATATVALVATSAAGVAVVLAVAAGRIASASGGLGPGIVGGVGLLAIQAAVLPNLIVWALGYALGPGFAAGPDGWVSPSAVGVVDLPDLPVLRALPTGALPGWAWLILAIFPLVGGSMLVASVRRATPGGTFVGRLGTALAGAAVCGLLVGLLAEFSAGGIGSAGAARLGPAAGWVGLAAGAETGLAAVVVTAAVELVARRESAGFVPVRTASLKRWLQAPSSWLLRAVRRQS